MFLFSEEFLKRQEERIQARISANERTVRCGRIDAALKARTVLPAEYRALMQIRTGRYGRCIDCGNAVGEKRLENTPAALRCIACQEEIEK